MKVVIVGGGMVGMTLAHLLRRRGLEPTIIERMPAGFYQPRGYMLGFQGYESLQEVGVYDEVRDAGRPIAPREGQPPIAVAVRFGALIEALQRDLPMENELTVKELITDEIGRVTCVVAETEPVVKGQTAANSFKPAILDNGVKVMVPPFVGPGEAIVVNTETMEYSERA